MENRDKNMIVQRKVYQSLAKITILSQKKIAETVDNDLRSETKGCLFNPAAG